MTSYEASEPAGDRVRRVSVASALLVLGGLLMLAGLPLQWSTVAATDGSATISLRGIDYAGYDVAVTIALGVLLIGAGFVLAAGHHWGRALALVGAVIACLWAALVYAAAGHPTTEGTAITGVTAAAGVGVYLTVAGAVVGLLAAILGLRGRRAAAANAGAPATV